MPDDRSDRPDDRTRNFTEFDWRLTNDNRIICIDHEGRLYRSKRPLSDVQRDRPLTGADYDPIGTLAQEVTRMRGTGGTEGATRSNVEREIPNATAGISGR